MTYAEKLRDPRWQKKRLEIMERDEFRCRWCLDDTKTLNVHHWFYQRGASPWEYDEESMITVCEDCHEKITTALITLHKILGAALTKGVPAVDIYHTILEMMEKETQKDDDA